MGDLQYEANLQSGDLFQMGVDPELGFNPAHSVLEYFNKLDEHITTLDQMANAERARKKEEYANPSEYERAQAELKIIIDKATRPPQ